MGCSPAPACGGRDRWPRSCRLTRRSLLVSVLGSLFFRSATGHQRINRSTKKGVLVMKSTPKKKGLLLVGGAFGAGIATVVVSAFTLFAGAGVAASKDKPHVVNPPVITGMPQEG